MEELFRKIAEFNGKEGVKNKFIEESRELEAEIYGGTKETVIDELVDVFILMEQARLLWDIDKDELEERLTFKVQRTIKRIESGYYKKGE